MTGGGFDAAFLAVGAHIAKRAYIPAAGAARVLDAVALLRSMEGEAPPLLGRKVVIYGGGNTALDVARTARRLGAEEAIIVYRRTREKMPAHDFEVEEALEEGVSMKWLSTIKAVDGGSIQIEKMQLDDKGFPQPTGEFETLEADSSGAGAWPGCRPVAARQGVRVSNSITAWSRSGRNMMTGRRGVFAGGDMAPSERTVTVAVGHGKKAARTSTPICAGRPTSRPRQNMDRPASTGLNTWYYEDAPATVRPMLEAARRVQELRGSAGRSRRNQCAL